MEQPKQKELDSIQIWSVPELAPKVKELADQEERTISKMGAILLKEALQARGIEF